MTAKTALVWAGVVSLVFVGQASSGNPSQMSQASGNHQLAPAGFSRRSDDAQESGARDTEREGVDEEANKAVAAMIAEGRRHNWLDLVDPNDYAGSGDAGLCGQVKDDVGLAGAILGNPIYPDYDQASQVALRALELAPNCPQALLLLGEADLGLQRNKESLRCFEALLRLKPDAPAVYCHLFEVYVRLGRYHDALQARRTETDLKMRGVGVPDPFWAGRRAKDKYFDIWEVALLYDEMGNYPEASRNYRELLSLYPADFRSHAALAKLFIRLDDRESAVTEYDVMERLCFDPSIGPWAESCRASAEELKGLLFPGARTQQSLGRE